VNSSEDISAAAPPAPERLTEPRVEVLIEASGIDFRVGCNRVFCISAHDHEPIPSLGGSEILTGH